MNIIIFLSFFLLFFSIVETKVYSVSESKKNNSISVYSIDFDEKKVVNFYTFQNKNLDFETRITTKIDQYFIVYFNDKSKETGVICMFDERGIVDSFYLNEGLTCEALAFYNEGNLLCLKRDVKNDNRTYIHLYRIDCGMKVVFRFGEFYLEKDAFFDSSSAILNVTKDYANYLKNDRIVLVYKFDDTKMIFDKIDQSEKKWKLDNQIDGLFYIPSLMNLFTVREENRDSNTFCLIDVNNQQYVDYFSVKKISDSYDGNTDVCRGSLQLCIYDKESKFMHFYDIQKKMYDGYYDLSKIIDGQINNLQCV